MGILRNCRRVTLGLLLCCISSSAAIIVQYQAASLGGNLYRYTYFPSGYSFSPNQDLDIRFDPALYSNLLNGVAPASFDLAVFQPNNPPGAPGDYDPLALINNPPLTGTFAISFTYLGTGAPGSQPFFINQFDPAGNLIARIDSGRTVSSIPEPSSLVLLLAGVAALVHWRKRIASVLH